VPAHPQFVCNGSMHTVVTTSTPEHPAFPHAMVLTAYVVLSPATNSSCHHRQRIKVLPNPVGLAKPPPMAFVQSVTGKQPDPQAFEIGQNFAFAILIERSQRLVQHEQRLKQ